VPEVHASVKKLANGYYCHGSFLLYRRANAPLSYLQLTVVSHTWCRGSGTRKDLDRRKHRHRFDRFARPRQNCWSTREVGIRLVAQAKSATTSLTARFGLFLGFFKVFYWFLGGFLPRIIGRFFARFSATPDAVIHSFQVLTNRCRAL
jgi:hypothetical protein